MGEGGQPAEVAGSHLLSGDGDDEVFWDHEYGYYRKQRVWTMNEIRDHPMFMEDMPRDISDNPYLLALQNLIYEGNTDEEMAEHFKNLGNEAFRSSTNTFSSQNALNAYTKGLEMECKDSALNSQLHSNRAAVSLRLGQFQKAVEDCRAAVKLDPSNLKAWYRGSEACEGLGLTAKALEFCSEARRLQPKEPKIMHAQARLKKRLEKEQAARDRARRADEERLRARNAVDDKVRSVLDGRGLELGPVLFDLAMYRQAGENCFRPVLSEDDASALCWPVAFLYDEHAQSDFVQLFDERCALEDQLQMMFPGAPFADWDRDEKYVSDKLVAYLETHRSSESVDTEAAGSEGSRYLAAPVDAPLADTLRRAGVVPLCLPIHIFVADSPAHDAFRSANRSALEEV